MATTLPDESELAGIDTPGERIAKRPATPGPKQVLDHLEERVAAAKKRAAAALKIYKIGRDEGVNLTPMSEDEERAYEAGFEAGLADCKSGVAGGRKTRRRRRTRRRGARSSRKRPTR